MAAYTIQAVAQETRNYPTKFGEMTSYKLKLEGVDEPVELGQKTTTPPPQAGATLNGHIEDSPYGKKFKKEQVQFGGGFQSNGGQSNSSTPGTSTAQSGYGSKGKDFDSFTMYLSYAKDLAVALVASDKGFDADKYGELLEEVIAGGKTLYNDRPGAEAKVEKPTTVDTGFDPSVASNAPAATPDPNSDEAIKARVDDFFKDLDSPVDL